VNVFTQTNADGKSVPIHTAGKSQARLVVLWNKIGTGVQTVQVVSAAGTVLVSLNVVSGRNDSGLVDIPASLENALNHFRLQAKSTVAADDPVFEGGRVLLI
jgi:Tfp pilus assembly protein PilX